LELIRCAVVQRQEELLLVAKLEYTAPREKPASSAISSIEAW
jgi:hypothetical protein